MDKKVLGLLLITAGVVLIFCALRGYNPVRITKEVLTTGKYNKTIAEYDIAALGVTGQFVDPKTGKPNSLTTPATPTTPKVTTGI